MKIVVISDTHGRHEQLNLPPCDILIHCGDVTMRGTWQEIKKFESWLFEQDSRHNVWIAGNHDAACQTAPSTKWHNSHYLCNSGIKIEGIKIWGSPYTPTFYDWYFMADRGPQIKAHWDKIPYDTDILITHGPPMGMLDRNLAGDNVGCEDLLEAVKRTRPKIHCFGHIHEGYGEIAHKPDTRFINASICNIRYVPVNEPVVFHVTAPI